MNNMYKSTIWISKFLAMLLGLIVTASSSFAAQSPARPFVAGSLSEILSAREGKPVIVVFWSIECPPCMHELEFLGGIRQQYNDLDFVLVSTDDISIRHDIQKMLGIHGLEGIESWVFSEADSKRLRYQIDRTWYGELPRTYFYDAKHNRTGFSGALTLQHLEAWLSVISEQ